MSLDFEMSVFSKVRGFFSRHKNKFIVGGIVITGSVLLMKYAQQRLREWQEKETTEFLERNKKNNHFDSLGRTCNQTVVNLSAALFEIVSNKINTEEVIQKIKGNPSDKLILWNQLKVMVFTKTAVMIYSTVMLVTTLKIQMSIVGGYLYKDPNPVSAEMVEIQEKYLGLCQNFLNRGVNKLVEILEREVDKLVEDLTLTKQLKLSDIEAMYWSVQTALATHPDSPIEKFREYVIFDDIPESEDTYSNLLKDTVDFLDSDEVKSIVTHCVNQSFIVLGDQISEFYSQNGTTGNGQPFVNPFDVTKPLAKLLPIINGLLSRQSLPHHLIQQLIRNEKLQTLSANIYESLL